ncbi:CvfB family protein [Marinobacterium arenosum]|uniref:CvfB family protein n=1 Tax=Marinobacterium arenosum TaxID=2862496 RepID=UPI001C977FBF|nr:S1-like domain-containing RNA-binding protein [Marinobacterium arenosum]MBY4675846.1 GntR family transcriptional regulator [Marinobacterium arenosum]
MPAIGQYNTLRAIKERDFGLYLDGYELGEILLPRRYVPQGTEVGDKLEVFIYLDSEDYLIATTEKPLATVGQFTCLRVNDVNRTGAFLDWGLPKDLLVPFGEQKKTLKKGERAIVYIYLDPASDRIAASTKLNKFIDNGPHDYTAGQPVKLLVGDHTDIGYVAIIDNQYSGVIYDNDAYRPLRYGEQIDGFIKNVRPDGKINLVLHKPGFGKVEGIAGDILDRLKEEGGFMAVNDKSSPKLIADLFGTSKKSFKMAIGTLYKQRLITIEEGGIRLNED